MPGRYVPLARLRLAVTVVFAAVVLVFAAEVVADVSNARYLGRIGFLENLSAADRAAHDGLPGILAALDIVAWIAAAIVFIAWLRAAYRDDVVAPDERRYGHGWAIGAWFGPILNLWRPKQVVNDVWRAATGELPGVLMLAWWIAFLLSGGSSALQPERVSDLHSASVQAAVADSFAVLAAALAIVIVWKMTDGLGARKVRSAGRARVAVPCATRPTI